MDGEGIDILTKKGMRLQLNFGVAQMPSDIRIRNGFWNREEHHQRNQNGQHRWKAA